MDDATSASSTWQKHSATSARTRERAREKRVTVWAVSDRPRRETRRAGRPPGPVCVRAPTTRTHTHWYLVTGRPPPKQTKSGRGRRAAARSGYRYNKQLCITRSGPAFRRYLRPRRATRPRRAAKGVAPLGLRKSRAYSPPKRAVGQRDSSALSRKPAARAS